jgi:methyl-accepting chemotaxis protein
VSEETFRLVITAAVIIAALCIVVMGFISVAMYRVISKVQKRVDDVSEHVGPLIGTVRRLADENAPRISAMASDARTIVANAKEVSEVAKDQAHRFGEVGRDIADRSKAQVARVDAAVDRTVDNIQHVGENVKSTVMKPVREAGAVLAGVKAAARSYVQGRRITMDHITQDEEMFI